MHNNLYDQGDKQGTQPKIARLSTMWRRALGHQGETFVAGMLEEMGWQILERNWRAGRYAEIDIIARERNGTIVVVEVKTRCRTPLLSGFQDEGFDAVHWGKRKKILTSALLYLAQHGLAGSTCRFDVIVVAYNRDLANLSGLPECSPEVTHVRAAFGLG